MEILFPPLGKRRQCQNKPHVRIAHGHRLATRVRFICHDRLFNLSVAPVALILIPVGLA